MKLKDLDPVLKSYLIRAIRDSFKRSSVYKKVIKKARVEKPNFKKDGTKAKRPSVFYKCASCLKLFKSNEVHVDHRDPVTSLYSSTNDFTVETYISRVYCSEHNLQVLCHSCHTEKTNKEKALRKQIKGK